MDLGEFLFSIHNCKLLIRVADVLFSNFQEYGLPPGCRPTITTDQGANIAKACDTLLGWDWLPCICHVLHVALSKVLSEDRLPVVKKCSQLATDFRSSPSRWGALQAIQIRFINQGSAARFEEEVVEEDDGAVYDHNNIDDDPGRPELLMPDSIDHQQGRL